MEKVVFVHGWGLNFEIWSSFIDWLARTEIELDVICVDLPGYGKASGIRCDASLETLAKYCLDQVSGPAIWVGWSLGGMVAMKAALIAPQKVLGLQLISCAAKFVESDDWPHGIDMTVFGEFVKRLANDYERALAMFLLLQAGTNQGARNLVRKAHQSICRWPNPSKQTLEAGLHCLAVSDIRSEVQALQMPVHLIYGRRDRVANPASCSHLANVLTAELVELDAGHAPFLSHPQQVASSLLALTQKIRNEYR